MREWERVYMSDVRRSQDSNILPVPKIEEANDLIVILMTSGTVFALALLILGFVFHSDWLMMMSVFFAGSSFAKSFFSFPERKNRRTRGFMIRRYGNSRAAGMIILIVLAVLFILMLLKRKQDIYYPLAAMILIIVYTITDVILFFIFYNSYHGLGKFMDGLRYITYGDFLVLFMLIIHIISAFAGGSGTAARPMWVVSAVFFILLIGGAGYLVVLSGNKIQSYMVRKKSAAEQAQR